MHTNRFENMHVIQPSGKFSTADMQVTCTTVSFSLSAASELHYPERVTMMTTEDGNTIALVPWESCGELGEAFSMPFFNQNVKPVPKRIVIREKNFVQAMRKTRGWDKDKCRRRVYGLYEPSCNAIFFNLRHAVLPSDKGSKKRQIAVLSDYPKYKDLIYHMKPVMLALPASPQSTDFEPASYSVL